MKGFVRSVEVVLAALLFIGASFFILRQIYSPTLEYKADPTIIGESLLNSLQAEGSIGKYLTNYDIYGLAALISTFLKGNFDFKITLQYFDNLNITEKSNTSRSNLNVSFIYLFPSYVDKNSIVIFSNESVFDRNVNFIWRRVPIKFYNNYSDIYNQSIYLSNINLGTGNFSNKSFIFFFGKENVDMNVINATNQSNVTIIVNIPYFAYNKTEYGYLYYATNETLWESSYKSLTATMNENLLNITKKAAEDATMAEIYLKIPYLAANEQLNLFLSYAIGTNEKNTYASIGRNSINNTLINVTVDDGMTFKEGSSPIGLSTGRKNVFIVERDIFYEMKMVRVRIYLWY
ncbi:MAG: hypothetical protein OH319_04320 [Candidatus Parvarchaeota archaeon]|nr:hypothetical protein [Candidatus Jingweiarchaeum tengchongense]MCW1297941.1 hypothetical protein [Candidatus Jingweiarchaeum tengchongense]MCW1300603.1 hypothetical protein [Candidatus Jingweiarchaeum tengchongense]MCW1304473.1 hypothetical protein [Candidatus Jingweiarchaeum tengchongense]MCW1305640.1 hypothetical protein [Candidatus Jingweiarchaeum tengchongense]